MKDKIIISLTAIIAISAMEMIALYQGINGILLTGVIGTIAGLAGYTFGKGK